MERIKQAILWSELPMRELQKASSLDVLWCCNFSTLYLSGDLRGLP